MKKILFLICGILLLSTFAYAEDYSGFIVKLKDDCVLPMASLYSDGEIEPLDAQQTAQLLSDEFENIGIVYSREGLIKINDEDTLRELVDMGIVEYAEPDLICELYGYVPENNQYYTSQWAHTAIKSEYAWDMGLYGQEVKIAVIDSGVNPHPDIAANLLPGGNFEGITERGQTPGTDTTDNLWHGTFVAGIIAAQCNDIGVVGLAHNVKIVPLKVCDSREFSLSYVIPAIYAAVDDYDCDVINMSLGASSRNSDGTGGLVYVNGVYQSGTVPSSLSLANAINYATIRKGAIVVAASGNDGNYQSKTIDVNGNVVEKRHASIPAILDNVVSVGNVRNVSSGASISYSIDSTSTHNEDVHISAPGTNVYSIDIRYPDSPYKRQTGTSFSTPYVSAAAAIMKCVDPNIRYFDFNNLITSTANKSYMTEDKGEIYWGSGMLDIEAMLKGYFKNNNFNEYISAPNVNTQTGECTVGISNHSQMPGEYMLVITDTVENEPVTKIVSVALSPGEGKHVSLTRYGFNENADMQLSAFVRGDSDGDGKADSNDLKMVADFLAGSAELNIYQKFRANMCVSQLAPETDSVLDIKDLIMLAQKIFASD